MDRFYKYIDLILEEAPEFMKVDEDGEVYVILDYIMSKMSDKAMPWLFKVYLDKKFNIIVDDELTEYIIRKYNKLNLKILNINGNLFLNKEVIAVILEELEKVNEGEFNQKSLTFSLI
ncbi:hypothetical protein [Paraclostridium sordellii]|uniref:hypothetical protein n=1 Tax=Paraclostridium sordellii TaxID=1505 RepID=UPI0005DF7EA0|nr:hypothetical protein [Paeniclostridium sordellii]CEO14344.1 Uncharacterised protein [[Clostridium] sordellii] [Paeniclostridium sordellii]CEP89896.1 Uncharacterised protein [[Clostridium] sordellii] [Paeniclostridium sordellii]CEP98196.1 Uncharacterised protein [[Clostridium] sordellii] [Paeniclostridium sordellii]CEQ01862.1 Uncharacterised protein [[Clostridium] sordellii] [Paeniclostridium sordellii]